MNQRVIVNNNGCGSGCGSLIACMVVAGIAVQYWYIAVPMAILLGIGAAYLYTQGEEAVPLPTIDARQLPLPPTVPTMGSYCGNCGAGPVVSAYCPTCGNAVNAA